MDFCAKYAADEQDRLVLEQYRPYITMMNIRAQASLLKSEEKYKEALETVEHGLDSIRDFFVKFGQEEAFAHSNEVKVLRRFAREIRRKLPVDPLTRLQNQLDKAIQEERYEDAAKLRDEIARRQVSK
jgi:protein-arginine kinase activator protein McsA